MEDLMEDRCHAGDDDRIIKDEKRQVESEGLVCDCGCRVKVLKSS